MCLILHILQKPNSLLLYFIHLKFFLAETKLTCIDVKFIVNTVRLGLSSSASILQIADVTLRVVFLLFLPCF